MLSVKAFVWVYLYPLISRQLVIIIYYCFSCHPGSERPLIMVINQEKKVSEVSLEKPVDAVSASFRCG